MVLTSTPNTSATCTLRAIDFSLHSDTAAQADADVAQSKNDLADKQPELEIIDALYDAIHSNGRRPPSIAESVSDRMLRFKLKRRERRQKPTAKAKECNYRVRQKIQRGVLRLQWLKLELELRRVKQQQLAQTRDPVLGDLHLSDLIESDEVIHMCRQLWPTTWTKLLDVPTWSECVAPQVPHQFSFASSPSEGETWYF